MVNYVRISLISIAGILTLVSSVMANDGYFTGNRDADWALVRKNYLQDWRDPAVCSDQSLYLEQDAKNVVAKYFPPLNRRAYGFDPLTASDLASCAPAGQENSTILSPFKSTFDLAERVDLVLATEPKDVACIAAAQKIYGPIGKKVRCDGPDSKPVNLSRESTPCRTEAYSLSVTRAFNLINACLDSNPRDLFKIFLKESGMTVNAVSESGAAGIGQVTEGAVVHAQGVEAGLWGSPAAKLRAQSVVKRIHGNPPPSANTPDPLCAPLRELDQTAFTKSDPPTDCELLAMPNGVFLPMYFGAKLLTYNKADLEYAAQKESLREVFKSDYDEMIRIAGMYGYSAAGHYRVMGAFLALGRAARGKYQPGPEGKKKFLESLKVRISAGRSKSIAKQISNYISGVNTAGNEGAEDKYQTIKKALGGAECFN
jgi:hypothetical protein